LVAAARRVFEHEPLPLIKRAESAGIPELLDSLRALVEEARSTGQRHLVLITGVPGSGKTLVGLQFVHLSRGIEPEAVFLSGNDPLVTVLQDALGSKVFVRRMHDFDLEYGIRRRSLPTQRVFVFDEAQRAWDEGYMRYKRGIEHSEPELLVEIGERIPTWAVLVGLVGSGQEIFSGEEAGIEGWRSAILKGSAKNWAVHVPPALASEFADCRVETDDRLALRVSIRARRAQLVHDWVSHLLTGSLDLAARIA
jgi:hypothetical protein